MCSLATPFCICRFSGQFAVFSGIFITPLFPRVLVASPRWLIVAQFTWCSGKSGHKCEILQTPLNNNIRRHLQSLVYACADQSGKVPRYVSFPRHITLISP